MPCKFFITIKTVSIVPLNRNEKGTSAFTDAFTIPTLIALIALTTPASVLTEPVNALTLSALVAPTLVFTEAVTTLLH
jgi:hypothetical protein